MKNLLFILTAVLFCSCGIQFRSNLYHQKIFRINEPLNSSANDKIFKNEIIENKSNSSIQKTTLKMIFDSTSYYEKQPLEINNPLVKIPSKNKKIITSKHELNYSTHQLHSDTLKKTTQDEYYNKEEITSFKRKKILTTLFSFTFFFVFLFGLIWLISNLILGYFIAATLIFLLLTIFFFITDLILKICWNDKNHRTPEEKQGLRRSLNLTGVLLFIPISYTIYWIIKNFI